MNYILYIIYYILYYMNYIYYGILYIYIPNIRNTTKKWFSAGAIHDIRGLGAILVAIFHFLCDEMGYP